jgi:hypothetical protein
MRSIAILAIAGNSGHRVMAFLALEAVAGLLTNVSGLLISSALLAAVGVVARGHSPRAV